MTNDADRDRTKTDSDPVSTWGTTPEAKAAWEKKYGPAARKAAEKAAEKEEGK